MIGRVLRFGAYEIVLELFAVGGTEVFDDKAGVLCHSWQAWSWQNCASVPAVPTLEVSAY